MVELELQLAEALLSYLVSRPYSEVAQGVPALMAAIQKAKEPKPTPKVEEKQE